MGWLEYQASYFKKGKIDVVQETIQAFTQNETEKFPQLEVIETSKVGRSVFLIIKATKNNLVDYHVTEVLTRTDKNYLYAYKEIGLDTINNIPLKFLNAIPDNVSDYVKQWKQKALQARENNKSNKKKLEVGDKIIFKYANYGGYNEFILLEKYERKYYFQSVDRQLYRVQLKGWNRTEYEIIKKVA